MKIKCPECDNWNIYDNITENELLDRLFLCRHCGYYINPNKEEVKYES